MNSIGPKSRRLQLKELERNYRSEFDNKVLCCAVNDKNEPICNKFLRFKTLKEINDHEGSNFRELWCDTCDEKIPNGMSLHCPKDDNHDYGFDICMKCASEQLIKQKDRIAKVKLEHKQRQRRKEKEVSINITCYPRIISFSCFI